MEDILNCLLTKVEYRIDKHKLTQMSEFVFGGPYGPNFELL